MAWTVYGDNWESGELADTSKFQTIQTNERMVLRAIRTWIIVYNNPTFTNLTCKLYSNNTESGSNAPGVLLASSDTTLTKAEIHTLDNGIKELYFEFDHPQLHEDDKYNFVINGAGYSPTSSSHLAWRKGWPDPVLGGYTPTYTNLGTAPYALYLFGADL